jgi:hypothetical protein
LAPGFLSLEKMLFTYSIRIVCRLFIEKGIEAKSCILNRNKKEVETVLKIKTGNYVFRTTEKEVMEIFNFDGRLTGQKRS